MNTNIFGALGVPNDDYAYIRTFGQSIIYDATNIVLGDHNADMELVQGIFVEGDTEAHSTRYKLDGYGRMQRRGRMSKAGETKSIGQWDVAFPLEDFADAMAMDDITWRKMPLKEYDRQLRGTMKRDANTLRAEILKALFNNQARPWQDEDWGTLNLQPLANGDTVKYPPVVGSERPDFSQHYLFTAGDATALTDANNPIPRIINTLEGHFGTPTFGSEIVIFVNNAQTAGVQGLAGFEVVPNRFVTYGANANLVDPVDIPPYLPGRVLGECDGALIVEWRWIPAGYMVGVHLGAAPPLTRRVDPAGMGVPRGLHLFSEIEDMPFIRSSWRNRYGLGVGNRLNAVVMDLTAATNGAYTVPPALVA